MTDELIKWIERELSERSWSSRELARRSGLSPGTIVDVLNSRTNPGFSFCKGIAQALNVSPESVLRLANLLPSKPKSDEVLEELLYYFRHLSAEDRSRLIDVARTFAERREPYTTEAKPSTTTATY